MKKLIIALVAGLAVFGAVYASAATLGLTTDDLGAGSKAVASCDSSVNVTYQTSYHDAGGAITTAGYYVDTITLTNLDKNATGCGGQVATAELTGQPGPGGPSLSHGQATVATEATTTGTHVITMAPLLLAETVTGVHVVITGPGS